MKTAAVDAESEGFDIVFWAGTAAAVALGLVLRFYLLGASSLDIDETVSWALSTRVGELAEGFQPPLYHFVLKVWIYVFGDGPAGLRSLSVLIGVATIPLAADIARRAAGRTAGIAAAVLLACQPWHVVLSRVARPYALALFAGTASVWILGRLIDRKRDNALGAALAVANAAAFFSYYGMAWLWLGQVFFLVFSGRADVGRRRDVQVGLVAPVAAVLLASPFLWTQGRVLAEHMRAFPVLVTLTGGPIGYWISDLGMGAVWSVTEFGSRWLSPILTFVGLALTVAGVVVTLQKRLDAGRGMLGLIFATPIAIGLASVVVPLWTPYTLAFALPFLAVGMSLGAKRFSYTVVGVAFALSIVSGFGSLMNADAAAADRWAWHKPVSWRPMVDRLRQLGHDTDQIFVSPGWMSLALRYHWNLANRSEMLDRELPLVEVPFDFYDQDADLKKLIGFGAATRIWLVRVAGYSSNNLARLAADEGFSEVGEAQFWKVGLQLFSREPVEPGDVQILTASPEAQSLLDDEP